MPTEEIKRPASSLRNAQKGRVINFTDENGVPSQKDEAGGVKPSATLLGAPLPLDKQGSAPAAATDRGHVYSREVNGVTELFYVDDLGSGGREIQLTEDGELKAGGGGAYFESALLGTDVVVNVPESGGNVIYSTGITLPALVDNSVLQLRIQSALGANQQGKDGGEMSLLFAWETAPTFPQPAFGNFLDNDGRWFADVLNSSLSEVLIDGAGLLSLEFSDSKGDSLEGRIRCAVQIDTWNTSPFSPP